MKIHYRLAEETRNRLYIETNTLPEKEQAVELDNERMTSAHRAHLVAIGERNTDLLVLYPYEVSYDVSQVVRASHRSMVLIEYAELPDQLDGIKMLEADMERYAAAREALEAKRAAVAVQKQREAAEAEAKRLAEAEAKRLAEAEAAARRDERATWIQAHGSLYLRKCLSSRYDCQRQYAIERAARDFPGYVVDIEDDATWKSRSGPSEAALDEAARVDGLVVWLTNEPRATPQATNDDGDYEEPFTPCEAVVIRAYLGKYDLVRAL